MYIGKLYKRNEKTFQVKDMPGTPDTDATITIKLLSPGKRRAIAEAAFDTVFVENDEGENIPSLHMNLLKINSETFLQAVTGWSGFLEEDDKEIPCTPANKKRFLDLWPELADYTKEQHDQLVEEAAEAKEAEVKN